MHSGRRERLRSQCLLLQAPPSIHPLSSAYQVLGRGGISPSHFTSPLLLGPARPGESQGVPRLAEKHSPSSVSWVFPWASSRWDVPGTPHQGGVQASSSGRGGTSASIRDASGGLRNKVRPRLFYYTLYMNEHWVHEQENHYLTLLHTIGVIAVTFGSKDYLKEKPYLPASFKAFS
ncbi:hypothetical protein ATANTOWER_020904 [Ataeniobius toweri]|uniref:Uncharacterized protein n=1 Tax=Ataeniobius toweri TaxID=208326 RepID=A0ABU7BQU2_9TELE|nr:hypothetical protein [Ataeniobius toweri]